MENALTPTAALDARSQRVVRATATHVRIG
jgi:hypothetical protein